MEEIKTIVVDGETWYMVKDIGTMLKMKNIREGVRSCVPQSMMCKLKTNTKGGNQSCNFVNIDGLKMLICSSRSIDVEKLCQSLGIELLDLKYESKEASTIGAIMKAFSGEKMMTQHAVLNYRLDLYFPDYNLVIECDENGHDNRDPVEERRRQRRITKKLDCQWLRFNPDSDDFNIFSVINQIFTIIKTNVN